MCPPPPHEFGEPDGSSSGRAHGVLDLALDADAIPTAVPALRHLVRCWLAELAVMGRPADELLLVATELVTNAIEASPADGGRISLAACCRDGVVELTVRNRGPGFDPDAVIALPGPESVRGRGLAIVRALTDAVDAEHEGAETVVRARRALGR